MPRPHDHLAQVTLEVPTAGRGAPLVVAMPAWCPGSYLIRDYARFVRDLVAHDPDGRPRPITKLDKATWAIDVGDAPPVGDVDILALVQRQLGVALGRGPDIDRDRPLVGRVLVDDLAGRPAFGDDDPAAAQVVAALPFAFGMRLEARAARPA